MNYGGNVTRSVVLPPGCLEFQLDLTGSGVAPHPLDPQRLAPSELACTGHAFGHCGQHHRRCGGVRSGGAYAGAPDLGTVQLQLSGNAVLVRTGSGARAPGDPVDAPVWLIKALVNDGGGLAGDIRSAGHACAITRVSVGDEATASFAGLGTVTHQIEKRRRANRCNDDARGRRRRSQRSWPV